MKLSKLLKKVSVAVSVLMVLGLLAACSSPSGGGSGDGSNSNSGSQNNNQQNDNNNNNESKFDASKFYTVKITENNSYMVRADILAHVLKDIDESTFEKNDTTRVITFKDEETGWDCYEAYHETFNGKTKEAYSKMKLELAEENGKKVLKLNTSANSLYDLVDKDFISLYDLAYLHINFYKERENTYPQWLASSEILFENDGSFESKTATIDGSRVSGKVYAAVYINCKIKDNTWEGFESVGRVDFEL